MRLEGKNSCRYRVTKGISLLSTRQNYDRLSRWYDLFSLSEYRLSKIGLRLLSIQPGDRVLEIGFGTGRALIALAIAAGESGCVCGIDLSPGMLAVAGQRVHRSGQSGNIFTLVGDAARLPYPDLQFSAVFMGFTLELFDRKVIPIVLAECLRILQPQGRLGIVSLAKKDTRSVKIYEWFHARFPKVVDCRPISVRPLIEDAGFFVAQMMEDYLWGLPVDVVIANKS
jgi:ubiquinone/menaquinone biosynthesis C-methylase UbiE